MGRFRGPGCRGCRRLASLRAAGWSQREPRGAVAGGAAVRPREPARPHRHRVPSRDWAVEPGPDAHVPRGQRPTRELPGSLENAVRCSRHPWSFGAVSGGPGAVVLTR